MLAEKPTKATAAEAGSIPENSSRRLRVVLRGSSGRYAEGCHRGADQIIFICIGYKEKSIESCGEWGNGEVERILEI